MNHRYGRDGRYPEYVTPEQEFETSGPYRQPRDSWNRSPLYENASSYGRSSYEGYAPSPYVPVQPPRGGYGGRGPKGYVRTDERIREEVCERLSWNDEVDATDITVVVREGEVTLEGSVETRHMKRVATELSEEVSGVQDVHNTVRVKKPLLMELKEKLMGDAPEPHFANTGTHTTGPSSSPTSRHGVS